MEPYVSLIFVSTFPTICTMLASEMAAIMVRMVLRCTLVTCTRMWQQRGKRMAELGLVARTLDGERYTEM